MRKLGLSKWARWGVLALVGVALAGGVTVLVPAPVAAAGPGPDCGPTREWNCVIPGCQDCPEILFEGTVCEKAQFEKRTGRVCSPA